MVLRSHRPTSLPAGPRAPGWAQTSAFGAAPYGFFRQLSRRYGDTVTLRLAGMGDIVAFSAPQDVKQIFALPSEGMKNGNDPVRYLLDPRSVVFLEGDDHKIARRTLAPPFSGRALRTYSPRFVDVADAVADEWSDGETVRLGDAFQRITFQALIEATLGDAAQHAPDALQDELLRFVRGQLSNGMFFAAVAFGDPLYHAIRSRADRAKPKVERGERLVAAHPIAARAYNLARVETWLARLVRLRRAAPSQGSDALSRLVAKTDFSDHDIVQQLLTLLIAGHDTTSLALSWTFFQILERPRLLTRLVAEVDDAEALSEEHLPLTLATVNESLRFTPGATLAPRRLDRDVEIGGVRVPAGACLAANILGAHFRVDTWHDPHAFRPERFLEAQIDPNTFFPFGAGIRRCLGAAFAIREMTLVTARLLQRCTFEPARRTPPASVHGFLIGPALQPAVRVRARASAPAARSHNSRPASLSPASLGTASA